MSSFITRLIGLSWRIFSRFFGANWLKSNGVNISPAGGAVLYGLPIVQKTTGSFISIGARAVLCSRSEYTALGVSRPIILRAMTPAARIAIGNDVGLSGTSICANESVRIGNECLIGADVIICDTDFHPLESLDRRYSNDGVKSASVDIGDNVFIGARSIILKGVTIGNNSVIGAGSVVSSNIPANAVAAGNPCKVVRFFN